MQRSSVRGGYIMFTLILRYEFSFHCCGHLSLSLRWILKDLVQWFSLHERDHILMYQRANFLRSVSMKEATSLCTKELTSSGLSPRDHILMYQRANFPRSVSKKETTSLCTKALIASGLCRLEGVKLRVRGVVSESLLVLANPFSPSPCAFSHPSPREMGAWRSKERSGRTNFCNRRNLLTK